MGFKDFKWHDWLIFGCVVFFGVFGVLYAAFGGQAIKEVVLHAATAAWIQAIGSILAICAAIYLGKRSEQAARRRAVEHVEAFADLLAAALAVTHIAASQSSTPGIYQGLVLLEESYAIGEEVSIEQLTSANVLLLAQIRGVAKRAIELTRITHENGGALAITQQVFLKQELESFMSFLAVLRSDPGKLSL